jgi:hypothetical protein
MQVPVGFLKLLNPDTMYHQVLVMLLGFVENNKIKKCQTMSLWTPTSQLTISNPSLEREQFNQHQQHQDFIKSSAYYNNQLCRQTKHRLFWCMGDADHPSSNKEEDLAAAVEDHYDEPGDKRSYLLTSWGMVWYRCGISSFATTATTRCQQNGKLARTAYGNSFWLA